jgi:hypothetical protein
MPQMVMSALPRESAFFFVALAMAPFNSDILSRRLAKQDQGGGRGHIAINF